MAQKKLKRPTLPLIPVRGLVVFPYMVLHFDVAREKSINALEAAMANGQLIILSAQKDGAIEEPEPGDIFEMGTVANIKQLLKLPGDNVRVLVEGLYRAEIRKFTKTEEYFECEAVERRSTLKGLDDVSVEAAMRQFKEIFDEYYKLNPRITQEAFSSVASIEDPDRLTDLIAANFLSKVESRQEILSELRVGERLLKLVIVMRRELEVARAESDILSRVKSQIDKNQREYFLREQVKIIQKELGDEGIQGEAEEYKKRILAAKLPEEAREKLLKEAERFGKMSPHMAEGAVIRTYIEWVLDLPWGHQTKEESDLKKAEKVLEKEHFGLEKVKKRILEHLAVRALSGDMGGQILCLVGPPGVGKTSIARSVAAAMGRRYVRMSLGGVRDEAEIRGHRRTYVGAMPGRIISALKQAGSKNALILLDEVDKMSTDFRGDPAAALLEVLDTEQNHAFRDHYIEIAFDLSRILFLTTANDEDAIPRALKDRMEIIKISGYTHDEKLSIAMRHLRPKQLKKHGISPAQLKISRAAMSDIIDYYTRESGVRALERQVAALCRKAAAALVKGEEKNVSITPANLSDYLGKRVFSFDFAKKRNQVGVATGLAWTPYGGEILTIEVNVMDGRGKIELTGHLGDIMKESARAAISYIRSKTATIGVSGEFYKEKDIHLHVPEGAVPKDGPSAGITIAAAIISALSLRPVRSDTAMTGEITLRGRVLKIGGFKEKALAAYRAGIKRVIIPAENMRDVEELPENIKSKMQFLPAENMDDVVKAALVPAEGRRMGVKIPPVPMGIDLRERGAGEVKQ